MNATAVETLERRLDATRRALIGERERYMAAAEAVAHARGYAEDVAASIRKSEQIIADLTEALDELRDRVPVAAPVAPTVDPLDFPCHSCGAKAGEPCRAPNGDVTAGFHATRGLPE